MKKYFESIIKKSTGAETIYKIDKIQDLWSGYGELLRYGLEGSSQKTIIVKDVRLPKSSQYSRGGKKERSHKRKLKSYKIEAAWYKNWSKMCDETCRIPHCYVIEFQGDEVLMVLEDLDNAGYPFRKRNVNMLEIEAGLSWLANFHATFLGEKPTDLWKNGTYWHLDTRPDELKVLDNSPLGKAAGKIDMLLKNSPFQTFVHGDAKLANFCFSKDGCNVAAVDFQYVGGGCGMKDVAYFLSSCLYETECKKMENKLLDLYFKKLENALNIRNKNIDFRLLEKDWRKLYHIAWTDFYRFLLGWSPGYYSRNSYSEEVAEKVISKIMANK